jgi:serine/threonine protein kinase
MEMSAGLHFAHTKSDNYGQPLNLIHRDVSPQNVLVSYDGEVKIVDFGIAKASKRSRETESGVIKGKFFYMSPEQAWGDQIDARTDIFSSGICLYEMITGEMLYHEEKALLLLDKVRKAEIPNMRVRRRDLQQQLEQIVLRALSRRPRPPFPDCRRTPRGTLGFPVRQLAELQPQPPDGVHAARLRRPALRAAEAGAAQAKVVVHESLMKSPDFDPTKGHSVLFDLNQVDRLAPAAPAPPPKAAIPRASRAAAPGARPPERPRAPPPDASFDDPSRRRPSTAFRLHRRADRPHRRSPSPGPPCTPDDDDGEEHTILESVWADGQPPSASSARPRPRPR